MAGGHGEEGGSSSRCGYLLILDFGGARRANIMIQSGTGHFTKAQLLTFQLVPHLIPLARRPSISMAARRIVT
jgi:hypothetical protein